MMHIFICPRCRTARMVSRFLNARCLECGGEMKRSEVSYLGWTELTNEERLAEVERTVEQEAS